jgi:hypothetical protein
MGQDVAAGGLDFGLEFLLFSWAEPCVAWVTALSFILTSVFSSLIDSGGWGFVSSIVINHPSSCILDSICTT